MGNQKTWLLVCSYLQPFANQRNYKNIVLTKDQFPTLEECQEELKKFIGFEVEDFVLLNWKEVNQNYKV